MRRLPADPEDASLLVHPQFDPVVFSLGPLAVRWYGLMYVLAFVAFIALGKWRVRHGLGNGLTERDVDDMLLYGVVGVILGGRLGYILFYKADFYFQNPLEMLKIWTGGMSFHGGFLGVLAGIAFYCWRKKIRWITTMDFIAPLVPIGLGAGRIGNFINGELPGRPTDLPWGMWFPQVDHERIARHPPLRVALVVRAQTAPRGRRVGDVPAGLRIVPLHRGVRAPARRFPRLARVGSVDGAVALAADDRHRRRDDVLGLPCHPGRP